MGPGSATDIFRIARDGDRWRIELALGHDISVELPQDYDLHLSERFADVLACAAPEVCVDLASHPAISSRQLGVLIALQRALRPKLRTLRLRNAGPAVLRLLDVTRTRQFFELDPE